MTKHSTSSAATRLSAPRPKQGLPAKAKRDWTVPLDKVRAEGRCRVCRDWNTKLDAAHVIPRSQGGTEHYDATVPLCRACHHSYDSHSLDLLPHLTLSEQAYATGLVGIARAYQIISGIRFDSAA
jgi:5-methylcytosine-specific restriction endonuclease McrA